MVKFTDRSSVFNKDPCQLNQRGLERHSERPKPTERRRKKSELRKSETRQKVYSNLLITRTFVSTGAFLSMLPLIVGITSKASVRLSKHPRLCPL